VVNHVRAMQARQNSVWVLVGRDAPCPVRRAAIFGIEHATSDLASALRRDDLNVVAVATPPGSHCDMTIRALAAGKHVVCEKPFARDSTETLRMLGAPREAGVVRMLGTEFRFAQGQGLLLFDPSAQMPAWPDDPEQGGGWLNQQGTHVLDQIRSTLGEIASVSATLDIISRRPSTETPIPSSSARSRVQALSPTGSR
jgi:predicted dehydrogenase